MRGGTQDVEPVDRGTSALIEHNRFCVASGLDALCAQAELARVAERGRGWRRGAAGIEDEVHRARAGRPLLSLLSLGFPASLVALEPPGTSFGLALACRGSARFRWEISSGVASTPCATNRAKQAITNAGDGYERFMADLRFGDCGRSSTEAKSNWPPQVPQRARAFSLQNP